MRQIHRQPYAVIAVLLGTAALMAGSAPARSQGIGSNGNPYYYSNQTYTYGMHLPQVPIQNGQDEVRSADGTTCRSSMGSNSAYLDVGAIGSQGYGGEFDQGTFYGRLIIPLGEKPRRVDCTRLYELEIQRLRHELEIVRAGVGSMTPLNASADTAGSAPAPAAAAVARPARVPADPKQEAAIRRSETATRNNAPKGSGWATSGWSTTGWEAQSRLGGATLNVAAPAPSTMPVVVQRHAAGALAPGTGRASTRAAVLARNYAPDSAPLPSRKRPNVVSRPQSVTAALPPSPRLHAFAPAWMGSVDIAKASTPSATTAGWQPVLVVARDRPH